MAENLLERQLVAAVRFARQGDKVKARSLLEEILKQERTNEQAWIWMASVVESPKERRVCIERVLKINPKNAPAQAALNTMVGVLAGAEQPKIDYEAISKAAAKPLPVTGTRKEAPPPPRNLATQGGGIGGTRLLLIGAAGFLALLFILTLVAPGFFTEATPTPQATEVVAEFTDDPNASDTPAPIPTTVPSATFDGTIPVVTRVVQLPPTFTPTITPTSTDTPTATATLPAVTNYNWFLLATQGTSRPSIYGIGGNGAGLDMLLANVNEFDFDLGTGILAFTETTNTTNEETGTVSSASRLFYVSISALEQRTEVTSASIPRAIAPAISPDGTRIAFASDADGDFEIYIYEIASGSTRKLTNNSEVSDIDPDWSSAGSNIVYASDIGSLNQHQIYNVSANSQDVAAEAIQVTDLSGDNSNPAWSPTSGQIVFTNSSSSGTKIILTDANGSFSRELSFIPSHLYSEPAWTMDGLYVVFASGADDRRQSLNLVPAQGGQTVTFPIDDLNIRRVVPR